LSHIPAFHRDPFLEELDTEIVDAGEEEGRPYAVLADTLFYPEGGGQPADHGRLNDSGVIDVQKVGERIRHYLTQPVEPGPAHLTLDWQRRWDHMQQHTAQHVLTAVALRDFGWRTTAFHLGPELSDIELDVPKLERRDLDHLEEAVAEEIRANRRISSKEAQVEDFDRLGVRSRRLPEGFAGTVRLVDIEGLDLNTCGGTHLRSTAEIGTLCLLGTEAMRGGSRVFFAAGDRVRIRMAAHEARNLRLRSLLDTGDDELADVISLRIAREKDLARTTRRLSDELAEAAALSLATRPAPVIDAHWDERDMAFLQNVARTLVETSPAKAALLTAETGDGALFVVLAGGETGIDLSEIGPRVAEALGGRGGGRSPIFQGKAESLKNREGALEILRGR
jgi:alanyl-tRNA synthetase